MEKRTGIRDVKIRYPKEKEIQKFKKRTSMRERKGGRYMDKKMNFKYFMEQKQTSLVFTEYPKRYLPMTVLGSFQ